jgi:hypothetical protein
VPPSTPWTSPPRGLPEPLERPRLEHAEQLHLDDRLDFPDLVEEHRAEGRADLEPALPVLGRPGEGPLPVAEELGLDERRRERGQVEREEGAVGVLIGTLRRECLDHVVVLNETQLRRLLRDYLAYYHRCRTHLSLEKDAPAPRPVECPDQGGIVEMPMVGGLHHRYTRLAA